MAGIGGVRAGCGLLGQQDQPGREQEDSGGEGAVAQLSFAGLAEVAKSHKLLRRSAGANVAPGDRFREDGINAL